MSILDLFAKSPFRPMQEHMDVVLECVQYAKPLFEALCREDSDGLRSAWSRIDELEGQADRLKNDLRAHLPKRLFLPVDRRDLLEILDLQDSIADRLQDVGGLLMERKMPVPPSMRDGLLELVHAVVKTCEHSAEAIHSLDELVEIGFRGREAERLEEKVNRIGSLEGETDRLQAQLLRELFRLEDELSPVSVMLWYQLIGWIGNLADNAEKVGNRLRLLIAT
jgi:predicted phosphate transport protein (TIGR00153 family)